MQRFGASLLDGRLEVARRRSRMPVLVLILKLMLKLGERQA